MKLVMNFLLYNNLFIYQVLCTLIYRRHSLYTILFSEYGCVVLQAGSGNYMKVREDGSVVSENDTDEICFEFKGPIYRIRNILRGHYTASINCCGKTFHCKDNKITEYNITNTYNSSTAYILLYKLIIEYQGGNMSRRVFALLALSSVYSLTVEDES